MTISSKCKTKHFLEGISFIWAYLYSNKPLFVFIVRIVRV